MTPPRGPICSSFALRAARSKRLVAIGLAAECADVVKRSAKSMLLQLQNKELTSATEPLPSTSRATISHRNDGNSKNMQSAAKNEF